MNAPASAKVKRSSGSGLFLIELIIAIVFFAVASAICMQLFVKAHLLSTKSRDMNAATTIAQNYAEAFKGMDAGRLTQTYGPAAQSGAAVDAYYGGDCAPLAGSEDAVYLLRLELTEDDALYTGTISIYSRRDNAVGEEPLCTLPVGRYLGG